MLCLKIDRPLTVSVFPFAGTRTIVLPADFSWHKIREVLEDQTVIRYVRGVNQSLGKHHKPCIKHTAIIKKDGALLFSAKRNIPNRTTCPNHARLIRNKESRRPSCGGRRRGGGESYHPSRSIFKFQLQRLRQRYRPSDSEWQGWASPLSGTAQRCHSSLGLRVICVAYIWHNIVLI